MVDPGPVRREREGSNQGRGKLGACQRRLCGWLGAILTEETRAEGRRDETGGREGNFMQVKVGY